MEDDKRLSSYVFSVEIEGIETARFQRCEGIETETYVYEVEEGGYNVSTRKFYGRTRYPNLILEKGISPSNALYKWYKETLLEDRALERKNGSIIMRDTEGKEVKRWNFFRAFPCRWIGPKLEANMGSEFALERIEIAHEGIIEDNDGE
jgi:phage tail-like protein